MDIHVLIKLFEENRCEEDAVPMQNYMKKKFPFLGIKTPKRRLLLKELFNQTGLLKEGFKPEFAEALWEMEEREYQYAALDYIGKFTKKLDKSHLELVERLIVTKSWWDTVDMLASHAVGSIASNSPEVIGEKIDGWAISENMWLRRRAILFQLKYKARTDEELLYQYMLFNNESKEFFIQKAIGWALREYSKTNPDSVKNFIDSNPLAKLSIREGSKYLNKRQL